MESRAAASRVDPDEPPPNASQAPAPPSSFGRRLLHRWFVEYNPLYLVSALLVLGGLTLISRSSAESSSVAQQLAVPAIAELYAFALIAGAALLARLGLRRPAVMLCLVTALYQGDLTLLTERQLYLGLAGALTAAAWLALFVAKIHALAWAMRLRLSRSAVAVPALGALGMALMPHLLQQGSASIRSALVAGWVFTLFAAGLWTSREVTSKVSLDAWGQTVLGRTLRATWILWATLATLHVLFWCSQFGVSPAALVPVAFLLATRRLRREASVWAATLGALLYTAVVVPESSWVIALLSAVTLALRALRRPTAIEEGGAAPSDTTPYRASASEPPPTRIHHGFAPSERAAVIRLLTGSIFAVHVSAWTLGWEGGALPPHAIFLDASLLAALGLMAYRLRTALVLAPFAPMAIHAAFSAGILASPTSAAEWGMTSVGAGFVLLFGSLAVAWRLRADTESAPSVPAGDGP